MKKLLLTAGILVTLGVASLVFTDIPKEISKNLGEVTNPKDIDYIAPIDFNGTQISYVYTDDNTGEDLKIATDQSTYSSWDSAYVNFAIKNISATDQNIKVQFLYNGGASASKIEEIAFDVPYQVTVEDRGSKDYTCKTNWTATTTTNMMGKFTQYQCGIAAPRYCDSVSSKTCTVKDDLLGTHQETMYKDVYLPVLKGTVENLKGLQNKTINNEFVAKEQVSNFIKAGETKHYRAKLVFTPRSGGEFYINAHGDQGGYGSLDPWYSSSWLYRKAITIDETKVSGSSDHTSFPVLVDLTDSELQANAQADGDDILFTSADGTTKLDHEIELYTSSTGRLTAWVRIPTLSYNTNTVIYMYYGNAGASSQQNATGVWDSNYTFVNHLSEASGTPLDSTSNNNDMSTIGGSPDYGQTGKIGYAMNFDGSTEYIRTSGGTLSNAPTASGAFTMSMWWNTDVENDTNVLMFYGAGANNQSNGLRTKTTPGGDGYYNYWYNNDLTANVSLNTGTWYRLDATYDGTTRRIYHNGTLISSDTPAARNSPNSGFYIASNIFSNYWDGKLDDPRMSIVARNADWIQTEYNNQSATSTFYTIGTQETDTARVPVMELKGQMILQGQMKI